MTARGDTAAPTPEELAFVEAFAAGLEGMGLFRMAGRVVGWLLIADPPEQTAAQLAEVLRASKGSISAAMKFLLPSGWVRRRTHPGDRRDHYMIPEGIWPEILRAQADRYRAITRVTEQGLALLDGSSPQRQERLREMHDLFVWVDREYPALLERWGRQEGPAS